ncbi:hypothetical protein L1765_11705 [Microaerobacter geothermalis]|uniref:hypothetical protein n=1 Tax=Microaerobacter geothermalis TaxID=674972 RepID=UPI001F3A34B6|nr:hypothetical protein [Microaerobacter geothermalis]MCF6094626.1 hypothetical protein [Microaerobacter geothermalis]
MRYISRILHKKWIRYEMIFLLGALFGAFLFLFLYGQKMDNLILENNQLSILNMQLMTDIESYKKQLDKRQQKLVVRKVNIHIKKAPDGFMESNLIAMASNDAKFLLGKTLDSVIETHEAIINLYNQREYPIKDQYIKTKLDTLIISTEIHIWLRIENIS